MEASTGIEPVWTDLQSAASPLRQLASRGGERGLYDEFRVRKRTNGVFLMLLFGDGRGYKGRNSV